MGDNKKERKCVAIVAWVKDMDTLYRCIEKMFSLSPKSLKSEAFKRAWFERVVVEYEELKVLYSELDSRKILIEKYGWDNFVDANYEYIDASKLAVNLKDTDNDEIISNEPKEEGNEFYFVSDIDKNEGIAKEGIF